MVFVEERPDGMHPGELSLGLRMKKSTIPNHEIRKASHIWMENQTQGGNSLSCIRYFQQSKANLWAFY